MKPSLPLLVALCVGAPGLSVWAEGPLARSIATHAEHFAESADQAAPPGGSSRAIELRWQELSSVVTGQSVTVHLSDGSLVRGDALVVRDDALVMDVRGGSNAKGYTGANAAIPRTAIQLIEVRKAGASSGRTLGLVIGVLTGVVVGAYVTGQVADSAGVGIPVFLGLASGMTIGGYYAGKRLDVRVTMIRVVP